MFLLTLGARPSTEKYNAQLADLCVRTPAQSAWREDGHGAPLNSCAFILGTRLLAALSTRHVSLFVALGWLTPAISMAMQIQMTSHYAFKLCSPTRASLQSGRYPFGVGFYDMVRCDPHTFTDLTPMQRCIGVLSLSVSW
jgi:hypothetical protein